MILLISCNPFVAETQQSSRTSSSNLLGARRQLIRSSLRKVASSILAGIMILLTSCNPFVAETQQSSRTSCPNLRAHHDFVDLLAIRSWQKRSNPRVLVPPIFSELEGSSSVRRCFATGKAVRLAAPASKGEVEMGNPQAVFQVPEGAVELHDSAAFGTVGDEKGLISICGFGSLLSEKSARYTFPNLLNFRVAVVPGLRRVFAHVAPVFLERGIANVATKELSSLSVEPCPGESIVITVFEISITEVPAFIEREHEFRFLAVTLFSLLGEALPNKAVICARYSDTEYRQHRCKDNEEYQRRYGRFNIETIWRDDILPCRVYLRHCVLAAKNLSQGAYDSFLDHTFLGDRITTIRQYLAIDQQIMQEEPPPSLRERYGG